jgi:hypothetical protein
MWTPQDEADYDGMKGSEVVTADGVTLGPIVEVLHPQPDRMPGIGGYLLLVRPGPGSPLTAATYVPDTAISAVTEGQVTISQTAAEVPTQPWPTEQDVP